MQRTGKKERIFSVFFQMHAKQTKSMKDLQASEIIAALVGV